MDWNFDVDGALWACRGLTPTQLDVFMATFERLHGKYAAGILWRIGKARGIAWRT